MQLIPYAVGQSQPGACLPLVLTKEMIVGGSPVVVFLHDVIKRLIGQSREEVGKVYSSEKAGAVLGVVLEGAVIIGAVEAQWRDRSQPADVSAKPELMLPFRPAQCVGIDIGIRFCQRAQPIRVQGPDVVEMKLAAGRCRTGSATQSDLGLA